MSSHRDGHKDPAFRTTISYIDRSRIYYAAQGFAAPYRWAKHDSVPFTPLRVPLSGANVAVVTTAKQIESTGDARRSPKDRSAFRPFAVAVEPVPKLSTADLFWHKTATHTDDPGSYLPVTALQTLVHQGVVGRLNERIFGVPTVYSHRRTTKFAESVSQWCREDKVDVVVLVPI